MVLIRSRVLVLSLALLIVASVASAQATRTWVSGVGDDVNPCSRTAPCKTFAGAISKTADGGEISVLDPGGFGAVTITKGITLNGEGTLAGILNAATNGVVVNITTAGKTVYLHGISINGAQSGLDGIRILAVGTGGVVVVEHSWIYGQTSDGIEVNNTANTILKVNDVTIEDVSGDCMRLHTTAGQVLATITNSRLLDCANGLEGNSNVRGVVANTVLSNGTNGVITTGSDSTFNLDDCVVAFWATGLKTNNPGIAGHIRVSDSIITQNTTGLDTSLGGTIDSFQGNSLMGNSIPGAFSSTTNKQ